MTISKRQEMAQEIQEHPDKYKVCEGCGSIVVVKSAVCPNCNAYRFDSEAASVIRQAQELAKRNPLSIDQEDYN
jgi:RNA polymerase subunit RPABC4/transcription elongation factor Spt4